MRYYILLIIFFASFDANSQVYSQNREKFINDVLLDADRGYYLCLKVKITDTGTAKILIIQNGSLWHILHGYYKWTAQQYDTTLRKYLLTDTPFPFPEFSKGVPNYNINDHIDDYNCYNGMDANKLIEIFNAKKKQDMHDYYFRCLIYKLFQKNVLLRRIETDIAIVLPEE